MKWWQILLVVMLGLAGCGGTETAVLPTPFPTPDEGLIEPELVATLVLPLSNNNQTLFEGNTAVRDFTVCLVGEPNSLLYLGDDSRVAQHVRHAIYEPLFTSLSYGYQPRGLEKLPSLADGDAVLEGIEVGQGELVINAQGQMVLLEAGVLVRTVDGREVVFEGQPVQMQRIRADFTFKPLVWSDGTAVTADDSLYAFQLASRPSSPGDKFLVSRTARYEVVNEQTVRWTGIPGWLDGDYFLNVWSPLPRHTSIGEDVSVTLDRLASTPLSTGPFIVSEWVQGSHIVLLPNRDYYRADEGFPLLDRLRFRFFAPNVDMVAPVLAGECHLVLEDEIEPLHMPFYQEAEANGLLKRHVALGDRYESLNFGINPVPAYETARAYDWFDDRRVRQALIMCLDRQRIAEQALNGEAEHLVNYISREHPFFDLLLNRWPHDPTAARDLLEDAGFTDGNRDGIVEGPNSVPFAISLQMPPEPEWAHRPLGELIVDGLADCGVITTLSYRPSDELYANAPEAPLFGRQFDLGIINLPTSIEPPCQWYVTAAIPGDPLAGFELGWQGANVGGWSNAEFDAACQTAQSAFYGSLEYEAAHREALFIFAEEVPVVPLYPHLRVALTSPNVTGFKMDSTQLSPLWNLFEIGWVE